MNPDKPQYDADDSRQHYRYGRILVLLSGVVMSLSSPIVRLLESAGPWQFLAYRSIAICALVLFMLAVTHRGRLALVLYRGGLRTLAAGFLLAITFTAIAFSILSTTIANALFLLSTAPFLTALLGWLFLGERPGKATWLAIVGALAGMFIMLGEGMAEGDLFGDLTALAAAAAFACYTVVIRGGRTGEMVPSVLWGGLLSGLVAAFAALVTGSGFAISTWDIGVSLAYGAVGIGGGMVLYTMGSKHVPAAELNVLALGEMVLAPIWVWLAFDEVPSTLTLAGGSLLLCAIVLAATESAAARPAQSPHRDTPSPALATDRNAWLSWGSVAAGFALIGIACGRWFGLVPNG